MLHAQVTDLMQHTCGALWSVVLVGCDVIFGNQPISSMHPSFSISQFPDEPWLRFLLPHSPAHVLDLPASGSHVLWMAISSWAKDKLIWIGLINVMWLCVNQKVCAPYLLLTLSFRAFWDEGRAAEPLNNPITTSFPLVKWFFSLLLLVLEISRCWSWGEVGLDWCFWLYWVLSFFHLLKVCSHYCRQYLIPPLCFDFQTLIAYFY